MTSKKLKGQEEMMPEAKASIVGVHFRMKEETYTDFMCKVPKSKLSREELLEKLVELYNVKGDELFIKNHNQTF